MYGMENLALSSKMNSFYKSELEKNITLEQLYLLYCLPSCNISF